MENDISAHFRITPLLALASVLVLTAACGHKGGPHVEVTPHFLANDKTDVAEFTDDKDGTEKLKGYHSSSTIKNRNRTYATIQVFLSDNPNQKPLQIDLKRHDNAYLAETAIYQEDKFATYISVGKDKDSDYVAGVRMRWQF